MNRVVEEMNKQTPKSVRTDDTPGDRLRRARFSLGYQSASDAARRMGRGVPTYSAHENGTRLFSFDDALFYAEMLKVNPVWLVFGDEYATPGRDTIAAKPRRQPTTTAIKNELKALALEAIPTGEWRIPERFLSDHIGVDPVNARIVECVGGIAGLNSSRSKDVGDIENGDRLIVDASEKTPDPFGLFIIRESDSLLFREVKFVGEESAGIVDIGCPFSARPNYTTELKSIDIFGRVCGRIGKI